jgi:hypothetical protein
VPAAGSNIVVDEVAHYVSNVVFEAVFYSFEISKSLRIFGNNVGIVAIHFYGFNRLPEQFTVNNLKPCNRGEIALAYLLNDERWISFFLGNCVEIAEKVAMDDEDSFSRVFNAPQPNFGFTVLDLGVHVQQPKPDNHHLLPNIS